VTPEARVTRAALAALSVAQRSGEDLDRLEDEIRTSSARLLFRRTVETAEGRRFTSRHESGHAVAATVLGIPFVAASLGVDDLATEATCGRVVLVAGREPADLPAVLDWLVMLACGCAAESRAGGSGHGGTDDALRAMRLASTLDLSDRARLALMALADTLAQDLVTRHWAWLTRVAAALLVDGRLTSAEVLALRAPAPVPSTTEAPHDG
jgi:hypothetical protein